MLKKQTVWLLTMLSLMIVLSVYYMSSPNGEDLAFINNDGLEDQTATTELGEEDTSLEEGNTDEAMEDTTEGEEPLEGEVTSSTATDEIFTTIRMELQDERSMEKERLEEIFASSTTTSDEKEEAYEKIKQIDTVSTQEDILEQTLKSEKGYQDVLVQSTGEDVLVTVKADELSKTEANNIVKMVSDKFGQVKVEVKFQPVS
ncbi:SpoIIIAH-like family protein [Aquibacillus rhizosphaerae]|uniref:SpoIIIAH-like family protein n=1 Tax=Aquibacillus rhizosphaerae TaxID=3051431 RepID=A0ABT7L6V7_9BACI|nr:SpoIIIAH-like family protein [Aquibacillus sp. LR5S19]MDL4841588.1 SpoIIIAH-like family protein [Aquibacillus sp. LR5S19]